MNNKKVILHTTNKMKDVYVGTVVFIAGGGGAPEQFLWSIENEPSDVYWDFGDGSQSHGIQLSVIPGETTFIMSHPRTPPNISRTLKMTNLENGRSFSVTFELGQSSVTVPGDPLGLIGSYWEPVRMKFEPVPKGYV